MLTGKKDAYSLKQFNKVDLERFHEFKVASLMNMVKNDEELKKYVPDHWFKPKGKVHKDYLVGVLGTMYPDYVQQIRRKAVDNRAPAADGFNGDQEQIPDAIKQVLVSMPYHAK